MKIEVLLSGGRGEARVMDAAGCRLTCSKVRNEDMVWLYAGLVWRGNGRLDRTECGGAAEVQAGVWMMQ